MPVTVPGTGGSLYEVLRLEPTATILEIKMAYRSLAKVYHPDFVGSRSAFHRDPQCLRDAVVSIGQGCL
ncbi:hypothetical protein CUMW_287320 [Citrus unshiu]|uniref:J domain-containing protein n=1 Tax=Citrus unshiu TaxID=55188 RepID=A0A2H5MUZ7_CITUN|nr:hypothetical protein CUMW_287320 [Citrus unshiu]